MPVIAHPFVSSPASKSLEDLTVHFMKVWEHRSSYHDSLTIYDDIVTSAVTRVFNGHHKSGPSRLSYSGATINSKSTTRNDKRHGERRNDSDISPTVLCAADRCLRCEKRCQLGTVRPRKWRSSLRPLMEIVQ